MDKRIGAQLYTVRDFVRNEKDFEESMKKIADIGYKTVQLSGVGPIPAKNIKEILDKYNLIPVCTHRPLEDFLEKPEFIIDYHKTLGCDIAGVGYINELRQSPSKELILETLDEFNKISEYLRKENISFAYHNHAHEFVKFDGKFMMDYFIENCDIDFILDVYWLAFAGINPADFIRKLGKRAKVIHFKDMKIVPGEKQHEYAEVMEGNLDWDSIISACEDAGCKWAVVEQDTCRRDPFDCLETSYKNLKTKGFN